MRNLKKTTNSLENSGKGISQKIDQKESWKVLEKKNIFSMFNRNTHFLLFICEQ